MTLLSCGQEDPGLSTAPSIRFEEMSIEKNSRGKDSVVHITYYYADTDGDIGLGEGDTLPPFNFGNEYWQNAPVKIFHKVNSDFEELINPITNEPFQLPSERIPPIIPEGKNKSISGYITVHIQANPLNTQPTEVRYELMLIDRALNESNIITTPSVTLVH